MSTPFSITKEVKNNMEHEQQYRELLTLKYQIEERLKNLNFEKIKELIIWLTHSTSYQKLKGKDNQLSMLNVFCSIWLEEKKKLDALGISEDIFYGVDSLESLEKKYLTIKFGLLRLENDIPIEYCTESIDEMVENKVSGIALYKIIIEETADKIENVRKMAGLFKQNGQTVTALILLQKGNDTWPQNRNVLLELADCWMEGEQWEQAYECLKKIPDPNEEIYELTKTLEKVLKDE